MANIPGRQLLAKRIRWAARIIGLAISTFVLMILIGETVASLTAEGLSGISLEVVFVVVPVLVTLVGYVVSWWREAVGGLLLVLGYFLIGASPTVHSLYFGRGLHFYAGLWVFALPYLIAGLLFLVSWQLSTADALRDKKGG